MRPKPTLVTCKICTKTLLVKPSRAIKFKTCSKKCFSIYKTGHRPYHWKGGKLKHKGYIYVLVKGHPFGDRDGYVTEHRYIMEKKLGRFLSRDEVVHHKNGIRDDNRIKNLELFASHSLHMSSHFPKGRQFKKRPIFH